MPFVVSVDDIIGKEWRSREVMNFLGFDILFDAVVEKEHYSPELIDGHQYIQMPKTTTKKSFKERNEDTKWFDRIIDALRSSEGSLSADKIKVLIASGCEEK